MIEFKPFSECATIIRGASPRPISNYVTNDLNNSINWIKIGDVNPNDKYIESTKERITFEGAKKSRVVNEGDFILSNSMSFGRPYIVKTKGCVHDGWLIIKDYQDYFNTEFLYYLLQTEKVQGEFKKKASKGTVKNLNVDIVRKVELPTPSLEIQEQIIETLDRLTEIKEKLIFNLNNQLDNLTKIKKRIKNSIFHSLSTDNNIEVNTIDNICNIYVGKDKPKEFSEYATEEYKIPIVSNGVEENSILGFTDIPIINDSSITISARGTIGFCTLRNYPTYPVVRLISLIPNEKIVDLEYLYHFLSNYEFKVPGTGIKQLTSPTIKKIKVPLPNLERQKRLSYKLKELDRLYNRLRISIESQVKNINFIYSYYFNKLLDFGDEE